MSHLMAFFRFWYDFIVGDDWTVAVTVIVSVAATCELAQHAVLAWWILPAAVAATLGVSVLRAKAAAAPARETVPE
jgi:hypothetical protein